MVSMDNIKNLRNLFLLIYYFIDNGGGVLWTVA